MEYNFDIKKIEEDVRKVLWCSQGFPSDLPGVSDILDQWLKNKETFINHMNGNLIYQTDDLVSFELDDNAKRDKMDRFADLIEEHYENYGLSNFIHLLSTNDFYQNRTSQVYVTNMADVLVPKNFKVVKAFKFFVDDKNILKQLQSEASRIIQENVISGYLCFSVHPLDYLSISENVHNWRSCHALDGDYRTGNLNYMVDRSTVVCYLRAEKQAVLPHFPEDVLWNSKKWRTLFFFSMDKTMIFAGRQYPFTANKGIDLIKDKILPTLNFGEWTSWKNTFIKTYKDNLSNKYFNFEKMIPVGNTLRSFSDVVSDESDTYQFNDLLRSSYYSPIWAYRKKSRYFWDQDNTGCSSKNTFFKIGDRCPCPICGDGIISYPNIMLCPKCTREYNYNENDDYCECEVCGSMTYFDDMYDLEFSGARVCPNCYRTATAQCQECGIQDLTDIVKYHEGDSRCLCPECWELTKQEPKESSKLYF